MKATFLGHSCIQLELSANVLLFDPFIRPNKLAAHIDVSQLKPDYILLSHGHEDHIADLEEIQKNSSAKVICIADMVSWLSSKGISNTHTMNIGGSYQFDFGQVKMVHALHSSSMPDGTYGGNPAGFIVDADGTKIYFAGDTALHSDMQFLADEHLDWAFLPIGDNFTMGVDGAIKASRLINCKNVVAIHYNTFPVIMIDEEETKRKFSAAGINLKILPIGDSIIL
ncbi:metal-dependent hydrolase [Daejeonella oryzae]|uniref:metal-dependent hydrolase n=1 Tax=Daejeonella oryzae TaxID=1122943 RepID=UPI000429B8B6|nr:metal-dependent hydrolase [Daejeonella oryzae]